MKAQSKSRLCALSITLTVFLLTTVLVNAVSAALIITTVDTGGSNRNSLALNSNGFPVISYYDANHLKVAVCGNATCSAGNTLTIVDNTGNAGIFSSLVLNSSGFPVISYFDIANADLKVAVCGNVTCSAGNTLTTVDSAGSVGRHTSLALNSSGFPVISYFDSTNSDLKVAVCGNATCSTGNTLTTVDSIGSVGLHPSLVLNSSGFPVISYLDITNFDLKVAVCGNPTCSTGNTLTTVDSTGWVGEYTSLVLNSSGFPVISYFDQTNGTLKVTVCGNVNCSAGNTLTTVDTAGSRGVDTSLDLNSSDFPVISYFDETNTALKVAVCGNATCTAGNRFAIVDNAGWVGDYSSLDLNSNDFPVISYFDFTNGTLKVATCDTAACDTTAPIVASHSLATSYITGPSSFTVTFSENVNNPTGDTDTDDVTNPANYRVINNGENDRVDTVSCAIPVGGDDSQMTVSSVVYIPNTAVVTLASPLPAGSYRLFVCGTTSIVDRAFNPIGGGVDYTFDFTVAGASVSGKEKFRPSSLPHTGFAPNVVSVLPSQPAELAYTQMSDLWLEIPLQNIKSNIVGVPQSDDGWDVKWLGQDTGWLNGTAFPTWEGNSVITGHVTDSNGLSGPFANLKDLKYGDQIIVHLYDQQYTFEVRNKRLVRPETIAFAFEHLKGSSYLTLITCQSYDSATDSYRLRRVIRAVLVSVK